MSPTPTPVPGPNATGASPAAGWRWAFFIAHAGGDLDTAEALYDKLAPVAPTFLDSRCIEYGDNWDLELARAQRESLVSVVLVSPRTEAAYYQREEIAAAIALARAAQGTEGAHRVVPLFLPGEQGQPVPAPYGLSLKHGLRLDDEFDLDDAAEALLGMRERLLARLASEVATSGAVPAAGAGVVQPPRIRPGRRLRDRLLGAGAVLAAGVVGLLLWQPWRNGQDPGEANSRNGTAAEVKPGAPGSASPSAMPTPVASGNCIKVDFQSPNLIPHYLLNSIGSDNFPYWLRLAVRNTCDDDRILTLRFERSDTVALVDPPQTESFTVRKDETAIRTFTPRFDFATRQIEHLAIHWSVEDQRGTKLSADSIRTEIVAPLTVAWDLQKPAGAARREPVEREFLLASLKAWTLKPPPRVVEFGRACRTAGAQGLLLEREEAIRACYRALFRVERAVRVSDSAIEFPAGTRQRIRSHTQLLEQPQQGASSLEAALLFVAVLNTQHRDDIDPDPVLVIAPTEAGAGTGKTTLLAWPVAGGGWRALDLQRAGTLDFDANAKAASARAATLLAERSELAAGLRKGVAIGAGGAVVALDFAQVSEEYRIRALP